MADLVDLLHFLDRTSRDQPRAKVSPGDEHARRILDHWWRHSLGRQLRRTCSKAEYRIRLQDLLEQFGLHQCGMGVYHVILQPNVWAIWHRRYDASSRRDAQCFSGCASSHGVVHDILQHHIMASGDSHDVLHWRL